MTTPASLTDLLDHARQQFQYHAGQRLASIRYFFATYAVFAAGYLGVFAKETSAPAQTQLVLSIGALIITMAFWALDIRNAELVEIDEDAMREIEGILSAEKRDGQSLEHFTITKNWEDPIKRKITGRCRQRMVKYSFIVRGLFAAIALLSLAAIAQSLIGKP